MRQKNTDSRRNPRDSRSSVRGGSKPAYPRSQRSPQHRPQPANAIEVDSRDDGRERANLAIGRQTVREIIKHARDRILALYITEPTSRDFEKEIKGIPHKMVSNDAITSFAGTPSHQGIAVSLREEQPYELNDLADMPKALLMAVDGIQDPQNFGALLRAAECFAVDAVIFSRNRTVGITPVVRKSSVGASELVPLCPVSNLAQALRRLHDKGFTIVVTADEGEASELPNVDKLCVVFGSEGEGVQQLIEREADVLLKIPLYGKISSLNVSQAAVVVLAEAKKKMS